MRTMFINFVYICHATVIDVLTRCYHTRMDTRTSNARQPTTWESSFSPSVSTISCDGSSTSSSDSPVAPTSPIMRSFPSPKPRQPAESRMPVYIDIAPQPHSSSTSLATSMSASGPSAADAARYIRNIDPTVTFVSPSAVNGRSSYIVLLDGAPVHRENTTLEYVGPYFTSSSGRSSGDQPILYNTPLVPKYWDVICEAPGKSFPSPCAHSALDIEPRSHFVHCYARCVHSPRSYAQPEPRTPSTLCMHILGNLSFPISCGGPCSVLRTVTCGHAVDQQFFRDVNVS